MRSESEILKLILSFAESDKRIRAVVMNGSRVNPNVPKDFFQDYDVVYFTTDVDIFKNDRSWIKYFGELMIMQTPNDMIIPPATGGPEFTFLMQFKDGNRIDLAFYPISKLNQMWEDSLSKVLLDKDGILEMNQLASDKDYITKPPSKKQFDDCCNEFWWVCPYVAKGLWRNELPYVKFMLDGPVRKMLMLMLKWHIGVKTNFSVSSGKLGKYYKKYLDTELWDMFIRTYSDAELDNIWDSLFMMCDLFRIVSKGIAQYFDYDYPYMEDKNVSSHLKHVRILPRDAKEMYPSTKQMN